MTSTMGKETSMSMVYPRKPLMHRQQGLTCEALWLSHHPPFCTTRLCLLKESSMGESITPNYQPYWGLLVKAIWPVAPK